MIKECILEKLKKIQIRTLSYSILVIACVILIVLGINAFRIFGSHQKLVTSMDRYIRAQTAMQDVRDQTTKLSEIAREYVITMDASCVEAYFETIEEKEAKMNVLYSLKNTLFADNTEIGRAIEMAMADSSAIMDYQLHSMRLITMLKGYDLSEMPQELQDYEITPEEEAYSNQELQNAAYFLLFDENYAAQDEQMKADLQLAWEKITELTTQEEEESEDTLGSIVIQQGICIVVLFLVMVFLFVMILLFVVRPLEQYIKSIENQQMLKATGARELRYLAETYNHVSEINSISKVELAHEADHDALTGLLNRRAFDKLKEYLKEMFEPTALILLDVDDFKSVNDNYGHECGDKALKKVAGLLMESFRAEDYPVRIGGDEFAVIMTKITPGEKDIIRRKIDSINEKLAISGEGVPKLSLSVGIAFSQIGYNDELHSKADSALYETKKNGKCGYTFYGDWKKK